jgi:hypothetical protein
MPRVSGAWAAFSVWLLVGCGAEGQLRVNGSDWHAFVQERGGGPAGPDLATWQFKPSLCQGENLAQEFGALTEADFLRFLEKQGLDARLERQREDLVYVNVTGAGATAPVRLRVAILNSADEAGHDLHEALLQHGQGSWGVHRSNLAILGPLGEASDDVAFAAKSKLACWGVFTIAGRNDSFVVPGGYSEL